MKHNKLSLSFQTIDNKKSEEIAKLINQNNYNEIEFSAINIDYPWLA